AAEEVGVAVAVGVSVDVRLGVGEGQSAELTATLAAGLVAPVAVVHDSTRMRPSPPSCPSGLSPAEALTRFVPRLTEFALIRMAPPEPAPPEPPAANLVPGPPWLTSDPL